MLLSWIVLIAALIVFSVLGFWIFSALFGRGEALPPLEETADVKESNRAAVEEGRFDDIQLEVVHRGYRMDQVDALIAQLTGEDLPVGDSLQRRELAAPAAPVPAQVGVESAEAIAKSEGDPTHGSNETAHR